MSWIYELSGKLLGHLADASWRSLCLAVLAMSAIAIVRIRSAAARHALWMVVLGGMLALPVLSPLLPPAVVRIAQLQVPPQPEVVRSQLPGAASKHPAWIADKPAT